MLWTVALDMPVRSRCARHAAHGKSRAFVLRLASGMIIVLMGVAGLSGCVQLQGQAIDTETVVIPSGTILQISLKRPIRTDLDMTSDLFLAQLFEAVRVGERTVLPLGTEIRGQLTSVEMSHSIEVMAQMTLLFYQAVDPSGQIIAISTEAIMLIAAGDTRTDDVIEVGTVGSTPKYGRSVDRRNPSLGKPIGLAAGAAAGSIIAVSTSGRQIKLLAGQRFAVSLSDSCRVSVTSLIGGVPNGGVKVYHPDLKIAL
jgi:hypothetical protein